MTITAERTAIDASTIEVGTRVRINSNATTHPRRKGEEGVINERHFAHAPEDGSWVQVRLDGDTTDLGFQSHEVEVLPKATPEVGNTVRIKDGVYGFSGQLGTIETVLSYGGYSVRLAGESSGTFFGPSEVEVQGRTTTTMDDVPVGSRVRLVYAPDQYFRKYLGQEGTVVDTVWGNLLAIDFDGGERDHALPWRVEVIEKAKTEREKLIEDLVARDPGFSLGDKVKVVGPIVSVDDPTEEENQDRYDDLEQGFVGLITQVHGDGDYEVDYSEPIAGASLELVPATAVQVGEQVTTKEQLKGLTAAAVVHDMRGKATFIKQFDGTFINFMGNKRTLDEVAGYLRIQPLVLLDEGI